MDLKYLVLSDTHLGEETSLLSYPEGRQRLWDALRNAFGDEGKRFNVEEMIMVGDIPDRAISSTSQIIANTTQLMKTLGSAADIKKGVFIPGNHDHTIWSDYVKIHSPGETHRTTSPAGDVLIEKGKLVPRLAAAAFDTLAIFFGYPNGSLWRTINKQAQFDFVVANPVYLSTFKERTYIFWHGTHFRPDVVSPSWIKRIADYIQVDRVIGVEIDSDCDVTEADSLESLEGEISGFVDTLWASSNDEPNGRSDRLWYLYNLVHGKFSRKRPAPDADQLFSWAALKGVDEKRIKKMVTNKNKLREDSLKLWEQYCADHLFGYIEDHGFASDQLTMVYGDTHKGGWGQYQKDDKQIRIVNTGGWTTNHKKNHPACHIFAVDTDGQEYILDITFNGVNVLKRPLIDVAAEDAEDRNSRVGRLIRFVLARLVSD